MAKDKHLKRKPTPFVKQNQNESVKDEHTNVLASDLEVNIK